MRCTAAPAWPSARASGALITLAHTLPRRRPRRSDLLARVSDLEARIADWDRASAILGATPPVARASGDPLSPPSRRDRLASSGLYLAWSRS
jgi:hypothetical protein